jgi:hypothetical protein
MKKKSTIIMLYYNHHEFIYLFIWEKCIIETQYMIIQLNYTYIHTYVYILY